MSADEPKWERIRDDLFRISVPGGWLYRYGFHYSSDNTLVFVPNPPQPIYVTAPSSPDFIHPFTPPTHAYGYSQQ